MPYRQFGGSAGAGHYRSLCDHGLDRQPGGDFRFWIWSLAGGQRGSAEWRSGNDQHLERHVHDSHDSAGATSGPLLVSSLRA